MQAKRFSRPRKLFIQFIIGCLVLLILGMFVFSFVLQQQEDNWNKQLATIIATDSRVAAFGDDAHAIPITPEAALPIGESTVIGEIRVTVTSSAEATDITEIGPTPIGHLYWRVDFSVENLSDEQINIHPIVDSQMQYLVNGHYIWQPSQSGDCLPSLKEGVPALEPHSKFECSLIYPAPNDSQPLYWVYIDVAVDRELYAIFQVR